jgi:hypothetical protein
MHQFFKGDFFNFEVIRILGTTRTGGADVAEVLEAVGQIKDNDPVTWHHAWAAQAEKAEEVANEALRHGHLGAARMAFLRASNYTRASAYMMCSDTPGASDPRVVPALRKTVTLFQDAIRLFDNPVHVLEIPYENTTLPAYLYLPLPRWRVKGKIPLVVNPVGADGMQEEIYHMWPAEGPQLGYAVLTFEGPGQGLMLHEHDIPMRPDWEVVTKAVTDYVRGYTKEHAEVELDFERVAIAGVALSGYFALRAASDPLYKACVAVDPLYDFWDFATRQVSATFLAGWERGWIPDGFVNSVIRFGNRFDFPMRWNIAMAGRFFGVSTPVDILRSMKKYTLKLPEGSYLDKVKCPVFVTGAGKSLWLDVDDHTSKVYNALTNQKPEDKELWVATKPGEGGLQAKMGAIALCNQRVFQFLDGRFGIEREAAKIVQ